MTSSYSALGVSDATHEGEERRKFTSVRLAEGDEHVHGADFSEVVFGSLKPKVLCVTLLGGVCLRKDAWSVVDSKLVSTRALR